MIDLENIPESFESCNNFRERENLLGLFCCKNYDCLANRGHYKFVDKKLSPGPTIGYEGDLDTSWCLLQEYNREQLPQIIENMLYDEFKSSKKELVVLKKPAAFLNGGFVKKQRPVTVRERKSFKVPQA